MSINVIFFFVLHDQPALLVFKMAVKNQVNYLGVVITKSIKGEGECKYVDECKTILNSQLQRDNTIFGKVLLSKMESL